MKYDVFGVEEKIFKDKKDGTDVVYYRAYGFKPTKREKGVGGVYCELKIDKNIYEDIRGNFDDGLISVEMEFDENGRVIDWVVL